jgi:hypothetical protein
LDNRWSLDREAGSYGGAVEIQNARQRAASLVVPLDATAGRTIHLVCEVTDDGTPRLTRYARVIVSASR